ncbi:MAG: hypothetical protein WBN41_00475 [Lysobacterales bacterium]
MLIETGTQYGNTSAPETSADVRIGRELLKATAPYAVESVNKSWIGFSVTPAQNLLTLTQRI